MTGNKVNKIVKEFWRTQKEAAAELGISGTKLSEVVSGRQKLTVEALGILLTKYRIDPNWLFYGEENEPLKKVGDVITKPELYDKHIEALEKINVLMEEKAEYFGAKAAKKNYTNLPTEQ